MQGTYSKFNANKLAYFRKVRKVWMNSLRYSKILINSESGHFRDQIISSRVCISAVQLLMFLSLDQQKSYRLYKLSLFGQ